MRHGQGVVGKALLTLGAIGASLAIPAAPALSQASGTSVTITVTEMRNTKGVVMACMTADPERFPRCRDDEHSHRATISADGEIVLHFDNVLPGTYAIALLHDENENGRSDRALSMIPREGYGFSRDAKVRFGPPDFEDAAFEVGASDIRHTIRMRYWL